MIRRMLPLVMLALVTVAVSVHAEGDLDALAAGVARPAATPQAERAAVDRVASALATRADALRAQRASSRLGWGDLYIAHRIATRGGHAVDRVVAARRSGATWSQIAEEAGVEPVLIAQDVHATWPELKPQPAPGPGPGASGPPPDKATERAPVSPPTAADEVRDKILRGGGMRGR
ncbi:MAG TPA: hypothetical protein VMR23_10285 [Candidatus Limnocylindria bacterium]|nr:hypothetical protein [Candidatus Limnocylindria bacterium]